MVNRLIPILTELLENSNPPQECKPFGNDYSCGGFLLSVTVAFGNLSGMVYKINWQTVNDA